MANASVPSQRSGRPRLARAVLVGGSIGGTLDLLFALVQSAVDGRTPTQLPQIIAAGLLGRGAFEQGLPAAMLGLVLHFAMFLLWAAVFVVVLGRLATTFWRTVALGMAFGAFVFVVMRAVVLPLSALQAPFAFQPALVPELLAHLLLFGVPVALAVFVARRDARVASW